MDYVICEDKFFSEKFNNVLLEEHLKSANRDVLNFIEIFKHMHFVYTGSIDMSDLKKYLAHHMEGRFDSYMFSKYVINEDAKRNEKVLKLLGLKPNRIN